MKLAGISRRSLLTYGIGDVFVIVLFVVIGQVSHGAQPWQKPWMVAETTLPFLVGWLVVTPLARAYQEENRSSPVTAARTAVIAWVGAAAVANLLRSTSLVKGNASVSFYLVTIVTGGLMLGVWRYLRTRAIVA